MQRRVLSGVAIYLQLVSSGDDHIEENMLSPRDVHLTCVSMATVGIREGLDRNRVGVGRDIME